MEEKSPFTKHFLAFFLSFRLSGAAPAILSRPSF